MKLKFKIKINFIYVIYLIINVIHIVTSILFIF